MIIQINQIDLIWFQNYLQIKWIVYLFADFKSIYFKSDNNFVSVLYTEHPKFTLFFYKRYSYVVYWSYKHVISSLLRRAIWID